MAKQTLKELPAQTAPETVILHMQSHVYVLKERYADMQGLVQNAEATLEEARKNAAYVARQIKEACAFLDQHAPSGDPWPHIEEVIGELELTDPNFSTITDREAAK